MKTQDSERGLLRLAGSLLVAGFLVLAVVTAVFHPSHEENNHPVIFGKYTTAMHGWPCTSASSSRC